jgi:hypothetical protein
MVTVLQAVLTSWPFWVAVVAVVFLVLFRVNLRGLIDRITEFGRRGILASSKDAQAAPPTTGGPGAMTAAGDELLAELENPYARELTKKITEELERRGLTKDSAKGLVIVTKYLAVMGMTADFENIEGLIWGSQIAILGTLNTVQGAAAATLLPQYDAAAARYPANFSAYPFEQYMNFLVNRALVVRQGDTFAITEKGRAYLMWRIHSRKVQRAG